MVQQMESLYLELSSTEQPRRRDVTLAAAAVRSH
jgi:hypothetical protein